MGWRVLEGIPWGAALHSCGTRPDPAYLATSCAAPGPTSHPPVVATMVPPVVATMVASTGGTRGHPIAGPHPNWVRTVEGRGVWPDPRCRVFGLPTRATGHRPPATGLGPPATGHRPQPRHQLQFYERLLVQQSRELQGGQGAGLQEGHSNQRWLVALSTSSPSSPPPA